MNTIERSTRLLVALDRKKAVILWAFLSATMASFLALGAVTYVTVVRASGAVRSELRFGALDGTILFPNAPDNSGSAWTVVHPNGWLNSEVQVKLGDRLDFLAGGRVNVDLDGAVALARLRHSLEERASRRKHDVRLQPRYSFSLPEDLLSSDEIEMLSNSKRFQPWTGPGGYNPATSLSRARASRRAIPNAPLGALIGQIRIGNGEERTSKGFVIGEKLVNFQVPTTGTLWLAVNDVVFPGDPDLYYADNVGFFVVDVRTH
jgi:hypothetical protein